MAAQPPGYGKVTIDWTKVGEAWDDMNIVLQNFNGPYFCDSEIFGKYDSQSDCHTGEGGVARSTFQAFTSSIQPAVANKQWTQSQRSGELQNDQDVYSALVNTFMSSDEDRIEHWIQTEDTDDDIKDNCCLLQTKGGLVLLAGCVGGHPYVMCNLFGFCNSDGSTDPISFDISSADALVQSLIKISETYAYDQEH